MTCADLSSTVPCRRLPTISLWQPWAQWVALGWKTTETRTHQRYRNLVGQWIGIHATQRWDTLANSSAFGGYRWLTAAQVEQTQQFLRVGGAVIAIAKVTDHRPLTHLDSQAALIDCSPVTGIQRYGLFLEQIHIIPAVPCQGKRSLFYVDIPLTSLKETPLA